MSVTLFSCPLNSAIAAIKGMREWSGEICERLDHAWDKCQLQLGADSASNVQYEAKDFSKWQARRLACHRHGLEQETNRELACTCLLSDQERRDLYESPYDIANRKWMMGATGTVAASGVDVYVPRTLLHSQAAKNAVYKGVARDIRVAAGLEPIEERDGVAHMNMAAGTLLEPCARAMYASRMKAVLQASLAAGPASRSLTGQLMVEDGFAGRVVLSCAGYAPLFATALDSMFQYTPLCPLVTSPDGLTYFPRGTPAFDAGDLIVPLTGGQVQRYDGPPVTLYPTGVIEIKSRRSPGIGGSCPALAKAFEYYVRRVSSGQIPVAEIKNLETFYETRVAMQVFLQMLASAIALGLIGDAHAQTAAGNPCVVAMDSIRLYMPWTGPKDAAQLLRKSADAHVPQLIGLRCFLAPGATRLVELVMQVIDAYVVQIGHVKRMHEAGADVKAVSDCLTPEYMAVIEELNDPASAAWKEVLVVQLWDDTRLSADDVAAARSVWALDESK